MKPDFPAGTRFFEFHEMPIAQVLNGNSRLALNCAFDPPSPLKWQHHLTDSTPITKVDFLRLRAVHHAAHRQVPREMLARPAAAP
ncbi:MAG TPA: hypothetical protein VGO90_02820 [Chthoniobacteraceae bacterium]|jgi:hypothetical protein|nr:hypothetical protein [Chthoniobacter sp.]HEV7866586.1 hypothetical protein [Chthoniobacteraceae bacterium]